MVFFKCLASTCSRSSGEYHISRGQGHKCGNKADNLSKVIYDIACDTYLFLFTINYQWGAKDFSSFYEPIKDSNYIFQRAELEKSGETENYYQAVALILKSYWFGFMTLSFGDMPYTNAQQTEIGGDEFFKPVYDEQKVIFSGILQDLEQANTLLKNAGVCAEAVDADVMYKGDALKWRKFANSLSLRFYMRLSEKISTDFDPAANIAKMVNNSGEFPILDSNESNASISFVGTDDINSWIGGPLYFSFR